jgi:hypothetical protein
VLCENLRGGVCGVDGVLINRRRSTVDAGGGSEVPELNMNSQSHVTSEILSGMTHILCRNFRCSIPWWLH